MYKSVVLLTLVLGFAVAAQSEGSVAARDFTTGTSFENQSAGLFDYTRDDKGGAGDTYWLSSADTNDMRVVTYGTDEAYDYAAKGMTRPTLFNQEPVASKGTPGTNARYLQLAIDAPLERGIVTVQDPISNVFINGGIYCDTLVRFTTSCSAPALTNDDRMALWLREWESEDGTSVTTNLVLTTGFYEGSYNAIIPKDYVLTNAVADGAWCRITVRAIANITVNELRRVPGFVVYVDGKPAACAAATYAIGTGYREDWLTPEACVLLREHRLFPWLVLGDDDRARTLSRVAFEGEGAVDDVSFSSVSPTYAQPNNVFTLFWDAGVKSMTCIVSNASVLVTNTIDTAAFSQARCDYALGTNHTARVIVTNVVYDATHEYTNGVWTASNDCTTNALTATSGVFLYQGESENPQGCVTSSRKVIVVGKDADGVGFETFAAAKAQAKAQGTRTLILATNLVVTAGNNGGFNDKGLFTVDEGDDIILDLCGHTVQGRGLMSGDSTISQLGGRLTIIDSVGGGAVLPPTNGTVAVKCARATEAKTPTLILEAGRYDGAVCITGRVATAGALTATCAIGGGSFTNVVGDTDAFYLESYVTNTTAYYALDASNYWSVAATDAFIWSGAGADDAWTTPENWKGGVVPTAKDLAIFPRTTAGAWSVDVGSGVEITNVWLDADIDLSGTSEFSHVKVVQGDGRFVGSGTMTFTGVLPPNLTSAAATGAVRIGSAWTGTVRISGITQATVMTALEGWGVAGSKVSFAGVCGYVTDKSSHAASYELELIDAGGVSAWKNDTGYTGSTISFPKLSGSGTFESPKNLREISQVFKFEDVSSFTGAFKIGGKRLLLGEGSAAMGSKAGSVTFANGVTVKSACDWLGVTAHFGTNLTVYGSVDDTLISYSGAAPDVSKVLVNLIGPSGTMTTNLLAAADGKVTIIVWDGITQNGNPISSLSVGTSAKAGTTLEIPAGAAVKIEGNKVVVNGKVVSTLPEYYKLKPLALSTSAYCVAFDEESAPTLSLADFSVASSSGSAVITVTNAKPNLWYGLRSVTSLAESFDTAPTVWKQADASGTVTFSSETSDTAGFYQVIMTDVEP